MALNKIKFSASFGLISISIAIFVTSVNTALMIKPEQTMQLIIMQMIPGYLSTLTKSRTFSPNGTLFSFSSIARCFWLSISDECWWKSVATMAVGRVKGLGPSLGFTLMEEDSNHDKQSTCPAKDSWEVGGKGDQGRNKDRRSNKEVGIPFVTSLKTTW